MIDIESVKKEIVERLHPLSPECVILFGSFARGDFNDDSDIDLYVVTSDNNIPENYEQKRCLVRNVSNYLFELRLKYGMDLLVHTSNMSKKFFELNGSFAREIKKHGVRLL